MLPLSTQLQPDTFKDLVGQEHLIADNSTFRRLITLNKFSSLILAGPPGCGKTSLARLISKYTDTETIELSATSAGVAELRKVFAKAAKEPGTLLFIDEIQQYSKAQQSVLLPELDSGKIRLICATTENPSFALTPALLSRSQVFQLQAISQDIIINKLNAIQTTLKIDAITPVVILSIAQHAQGDLRKAISYLDNLAQILDGSSNAKLDIQTFFNSQSLTFNHTGADFYSVLSALIKSIRGSDPDAAVYWLAVLLEVGAPLTAITRRLMISASEEIGTADTNALTLATATHQAVQSIGLPEAEIVLSNCVLYLACAEKSPAAYLAIKSSKKYVTENGISPVPEHLKTSASTTFDGHKGVFNKSYEWSHDFPQWNSAQRYTSEDIHQQRFYFPTDAGFESKLELKISNQRKLQCGQLVVSETEDKAETPISKTDKLHSSTTPNTKSIANNASSGTAKSLRRRL